MLCPIFSIQDGLKANDEKEKKIEQEEQLLKEKTIDTQVSIL